MAGPVGPYKILLGWTGKNNKELANVLETVYNHLAKGLV
jgi:hypothetical protein